MAFKIHYISPFDVNRQFGTSINNAIAQLNPDHEDWICLRDQDVAFLTPDAGRLIYGAVEKYRNEYDLIGCYTNRLGGLPQTEPYTNHDGPCYFKTPFDRGHIFNHYNIAKGVSDSHGSNVLPFHHDIAGFFMLFSVKIWRKIGGFKDTIVFDREFTKGVRMNGGKVGIMPGLYVLHCYRLWAPTRDEARKSVDHLIK